MFQVCRVATRSGAQLSRHPGLLLRFPMSTASAGPDGRQPRIVAKTDADTAAVQSALEKLLGSEMQSPSPGRWSLTTSGHGIERSFKFKNFTKTWVSEMLSELSGEAVVLSTSRMADTMLLQDFMTAVALQCKLKNHHPEWSNVCRAFPLRRHCPPTAAAFSSDRWTYRSTRQRLSGGRHIAPSRA